VESQYLPIIYQTGMLPNPQSLINLSTYLTHTRAPLEPPVPFPGTPSSSDLSVLHSPIPTGTLTESDIHDLKELYNHLVQICTHAANRRVRVIIDAEQRCVSSSIASLSFLFQVHSFLSIEITWKNYILLIISSATCYRYKLNFLFL